MKNFIGFLFAIMMFTLTSCGEHSDGTSVWGDYLWILPVITGFGALFFAYKAWLASRSGSTKQLPDGTIDKNSGNIDFIKQPYAKYAGILVLVTLVIIWLVNREA